MRDELLKAVRAKVAPPEDVARWVRQLAGTVIQERRKRFSNEAEARLSIDVELSSPGIPLPDRSAGSKPDAVKTTPAPPMQDAPVAPMLPRQPAVASKPPMPAPVFAPKPATPPPAPAIASKPHTPAPALAPEPEPARLVIAPQVAFSPAMTPAMVELPAVQEPPVSEQPARKGKKKIAWMAVAACLAVGVVLGTWLGLRATQAGAPERSAAAPAPSSSAPVARTAETPPAATVAAEPPATARPEEPKPEEAKAAETRPMEGAPAGGQANPIARTGPATTGASDPTAPEASQAAPAATPEPIPGPPPRPTKRDTEPRKTKGKYQPLGI